LFDCIEKADSCFYISGIKISAFSIGISNMSPILRASVTYVEKYWQYW